MTEMRSSFDGHGNMKNWNWNNAIEIYSNTLDTDNPVESFKSYLDARSNVFDVVNFYNEYGSFRNTDELSKDEKRKINKQVFNREENNCYYNAQTGVNSDFKYVEGYVIIDYDVESCFIPHAWLEINGKVAEITMPDKKPEHYYGVEYEESVVREALIERALADPLSEEPEKYPPKI